MEVDSHRPLKNLAESFSGIAENVNRDSGVEVAAFANACDRLSVLFGSLGVAFKFAEKDYVAKVKDLGEAGKEFDTIPAMIDGDMRSDKVRQAGSHTRNLLRVLRGVDMVRILFQQTLTTPGNSLRSPASTAYDEVFAPYHSWPIRTAVAAGMYVLPSKSHFLEKLNEKEDSAKEYMGSFVNSSESVLQYLNGLYTSRDLGTDW